MSFLLTGQIVGFDRIRLPSSAWKPGDRKPVAATGFSPQTSVFNLQERLAAAPGSFLPQNLTTRVPAGWATNPLNNARPSIHPGNGIGKGGQAI